MNDQAPTRRRRCKVCGALVRHLNAEGLCESCEVSDPLPLDYAEYAAELGETP